MEDLLCGGDLNWTPERDMTGEAVKLVFNSLVVMKKDTGGRMDKGCGRAGWLHNLAKEVTDHITCKLDQPTSRCSGRSGG